MILKKINYYEYKGNEKYWEIKDVNFDLQNLIVGLNATGKTRLLNVISGLSKVLSKKVQKFVSGHWETEFFDKKSNDVYTYILDLEETQVAYEEMKKNGDLVLERRRERGQLKSFTSGEMMNFAPPVDELTLYVRRDVKEFPFLEKLLYWANNFHGYKFTEISPRQIAIPSTQDAYLEDLGTMPYLLAQALKERDGENTIIEDLTSIGYPVEKVVVEAERLPGFPTEIFMSSVKEADLLCFTKQMSMSQGMYRAFSLIVIIEYLLTLKKECSVAIDDIGEGLDFDRSSKITKLLFDKIKNSNIQLLAATNDRFLINSVDISLLNLLERSGHVVTSCNYLNSKDKFDAFKITGLSNFDFFSGQMYKELGNN